MHPARLIATTLALILSTGAALQGQVVLETTAGHQYKGRIVSDEDSKVAFETVDGMTLTLPHEKLTVKSRYVLRRERTADDGEAQLELAEWCVDNALYEEAKRHYRDALEAAPLMSDEINKSLTRSRTKAANEVLGRAKAAMDSGNQGEARRLLSAIVHELPLEKAAQEAARLLAQDTEERKQAPLSHASRARQAAGPTSTAVRADGEPFSPATYNAFGDVISAYKKILDHTHEGLKTSQQSSSIKQYEKALKEGEKCRKAVDKLRPQVTEGDEMAEAVALADSKLEEALVDARMYMVDAYLLRSSYNQASDVVKQGLVEYPDNATLRNGMKRVTDAANFNSGGGWVVTARPGRR